VKGLTNLVIAGYLRNIWKYSGTRAIECRVLFWNLEYQLYL